MSFSQQYYYVISLMSWGIIFLTLGMTIMLRNQYNPFADPVIAIFIVLIIIGVFIVTTVMGMVQSFFKIWEVSYNPVITIDVSQVNKLDKDYSMKMLVRNLQTNPFRHKFLRVNREWIIHNIASILGGKNYMKNAGPEYEFL